MKGHEEEWEGWRLLYEIGYQLLKILARNDTVTDNYGTVDLPAHNAVENVQTEAVVNYSVPVANHCTITCE